MDISAPTGFICDLSHSIPATMKNLIPVITLLLLGGCATPSATAPAPATGVVATIKGDPAGTAQDYMGDEIHCQMQSIDGDSVGATYQLKPGKHTLIANLASQGKEYVGVVQLLIPEARAYRIRARRQDDAVTVTLVDEEAAKIIATSTAPLSEHMQFFVFVVQK